jgi:hypothetical protein
VIAIFFCVYSLSGVAALLTEPSEASTLANTSALTISASQMLSFLSLTRCTYLIIVFCRINHVVGTFYLVTNRFDVTAWLSLRPCFQADASRGILTA